MSDRRWAAEQVVDMRARYRAGETQTQLAEAFGAHQQLIKSALFGLTYADVPGWLTVAERRARPGRGARVAPIIGDGMWT